MPYRKEQFITGEIYHLIIRALDDNLIFKDVNDYYRGIFSIYEFNNANSVEIWRRRRERTVEKKKEKLWDIGSPTALQKDSRDKLVEVLVFCFMPNHIHLLARQLKDDGISKFMQKIGIGLGKYFNGKYKRKGHVFQDAFRSIQIKNDSQLMTVFNYIHINPLSIAEPGWKEKGIKNIKKAIEFLENYKWSSYQDYIGLNNFPSVTEREFLLELIGRTDGCKKAIQNWIEYKKDIIQGSDLFLD